MRRIALALGLLALLAPASAAAQDGLDATIRRTPHGVPHIEAKDFAGLGYGYGYALAQDNLCTIAEQYVTVRAERSRFFGPDATYTWRANALDQRNLESDFTFKRIIDTRVVEGLIAKAPPQRPAARGARARCAATTAGYNRYLRETGVANLARPGLPRQPRGCGRSRRSTSTAASTSSRCSPRPASRSTASAARSRPTPALPGAAAAGGAATSMRSQDRLPLGGIGSNAYGLGRDKTSTTARACCSATRTSRGTAPSASTRRTSRSPGKIDVSGGEPARRAGRADRPHARARVEPHGLHRVPLHAVRAHARARLADHLPRRRAAAADDRPRGDRAGAPAPTAASSRAPARSTRPRYGPGLHLAARAAAVPVDAGQGVRARRRERRQLPLPQPLLRDQPRPDARASTTRCCAATRASRGSTRSARTRAARPTTPTSRSSRT